MFERPGPPSSFAVLLLGLVVAVEPPPVGAQSECGDAATVCRRAAGPCDVAETCDGTPACPPDAFAPRSMVCRAAVDACDLDDMCLGTSADCPTVDRVKTGFDGVICAFTRSSDPPACAGETLTVRIVRLFRAAGRQVAAPARSPRAARAHTCAAGRKLRRALAIVDRATVRRRRPLAVACGTELRHLVGDALRRVETIGVRCPPPARSVLRITGVERGRVG